MMVLAASLEPSRIGDVFMSFLGIVFEGAPYIVVGTLISGFIDAFLPAKFIDRALPRNKVIATLLAGFLGLIFPVCECAIVPVIRRLVQKGLPISCAITYMLAAPIMNPIVAASTVTAFMNDPLTRDSMKLLSWSDLLHPVLLVHDLCAAVPMVVARLSLGYIVAVLAGLVVIFMKPRQLLRDSVVDEMDAAAAAPPERPAGFDTKLVRAMRGTMRDFLDTGMYFAMGVGITAIFSTQINQAVLGQVAGNGWIAIPAIMLLALILSLCSTSDAFIAANLPSFSFAAKLAFLVYGPMMDMKLLFMYSAVFKRRIVLVMLFGLMFVVGLLSGPWATFIQNLATTVKP
ncbi:MAG: hypothetical protein JWO08_1195 [Verrucomicrobiaceae bacterium]|nr:hypothetical protein [Verrucomicrobiaceae bacterium]